MAGPQIRVIGLSEFRNRVRRASQAKPKVMRSGLNVVGQVIVRQALRDFPGKLSTDPYNVSRRTGKLEGSIRALSTTTEGRVVEGTPKRVPYAGWWEFGKKKPGNRPPQRRWVSEGRVLWPALGKVTHQVREEMERVLNQIAAIINR